MSDNNDSQSPRPSLPEGNEPLLERLGGASAFDDPATREGLDALSNKVAPLLQGNRFDNIVDLMSLISDVVDMTDDAMVEKMMRTYEESTGAAWAVGNAVRQASHVTATNKVPSRMGLISMLGDEDVRRGIFLMLNMMSVLGRQNQPVK